MTSTRPPGTTTRAISRTPFGMSGNSMTPNCEPAMSKLSCSNASACPSITRVSISSPSLRRAAAEQFQHDGRLIDGDHLGANPRRRDAERAAAGRDVEEAHPGAKPRARRPSWPSPICVSVLVRSYPGAIWSQASRVSGPSLESSGFGCGECRAQLHDECGWLLDRWIIGCAVDNMERPAVPNACCFRYGQWSGKVMPTPRSGQSGP